MNYLKKSLVFSSVGITSALGYTFYNKDIISKKYIIPKLYSMDPEEAHNLAIKFMSYGFMPKYEQFKDKSLNVHLWNKTFKNPVGLAAGFDKHAKAYDSLSKIGFGFLELGSVTLQPQNGNPKPRIHRFKDSIINSCGFNSDGLDTFYKRISKRDNNDCIIGTNIGKNLNTNNILNDYQECIEKLDKYSDYMVINISSPNTVNLTNLQNKENLETILMRVKSCSNKPILIKLSPDLEYEQLTDIRDLVFKYNVDGLIISNTSKIPAGGLSGKPIYDKSNQVLYDMYKLTYGKVPLIGVGGIFTGDDAYQKIKNGASLVQIYTSFILEGPEVINNINTRLYELLKRDGYESIEDAIGVDIKNNYWNYLYYQTKYENLKKNIYSYIFNIDY